MIEYHNTIMFNEKKSFSFASKYKGNGSIRTSDGIEITQNIPERFQLNPVGSKGKVNTVMMEIPIHKIDEVISALEDLKRFNAHTIEKKDRSNMLDHGAY